MAKTYYDRKHQESQYNKYEEKIKEISDMLKDPDSGINLMPFLYLSLLVSRDKLREALTFLKKAQDQYAEVIN